MARSEPSSWGPAYVTMGYTVNLQPQPFTEPSLVNFQRNSSPVNQKNNYESGTATKEDKLQELDIWISLKWHNITS